MEVLQTSPLATWVRRLRKESRFENDNDYHARINASIEAKSDVRVGVA
jgi:hypothetical protein